MSSLEFQFLGDYEVRRDGQPAALPPSKKTRALLAFLSLNERKFRREHLCELLWEIPDDPRGSLRWSLSKLRQVVDDERLPRIIADRSTVSVDATDVAIDSLELQRVAGTLASTSTEDLERAAAKLQGTFLEGLELSSFHDFHAWCVAERERALHAQAALLRELIGRYADVPEQALPHARRLVALSPYDEDARATLIRLLVSLHFSDEAEQQYLLGARMLKEVGAQPTGVLHAALKGTGTTTPTSKAAAPAPARARKTASPEQRTGNLFGRDDELETIRTCFTDAVAGNGASVLMLTGAPGIGKSRIVEAVAALAHQADALLLSANAYESESLRPFALWIDALRQKVADAAAEIFAENASSDREHLLQQIGALVRREAKDGPVVLIFDDTHWCDESSAAAVHYVARTNRDMPLFFLLAARESEAQDNIPLQQMLRGLRHDGMLVECALGPMSEDALRTLIADRVPGADAARLSRNCGGSPLLAIELARAELEGETGTSLNELARERLARFDMDGAEILRWASVLSPHIDVGTLAALTSQSADRIGAALEAAERQAMLSATDAGLRFSHELIARGVYNEISPLRRQVMHRRVATHLEEGTALDLNRAADLAHHASLSGDEGLAARAMVLAGRLSLRFFANDEALSLARKGMQLVTRLPDAERIRISIDLYDIVIAAAPTEDWDAVAAEVATLAEEAVDHGELAHARLGYHLAASVRWQQGQWSDAREQTLQSERVSRSSRVEDQIAGLADTAKCLLLLERDLPQADAMLMEAQALASRKRYQHQSLPAGIGILRFHQSRLDEAEEAFKDARTLCKAVGDRFGEFQCNEYLAMIDVERQQFDRALAHCAQMSELGDKLREGSEGPFARAMTGLCEYALERDNSVLDQGLEALRIADAKHRLAYVQIKAAQIDYRNDRSDSAARRAAEALELASLLQRPTEAALARALLAAVSRDSDDETAADEHGRALQALTDAGIAAWALSYIESLDRSTPRAS